jgi:aryl-alcohol dehydrogenase-like predicted oxidoreductase
MYAWQFAKAQYTADLHGWSRAWLLAQLAVTSPIFGAAKVDHVTDAIAGHR